MDYSNLNYDWDKLQVLSWKLSDLKRKYDESPYSTVNFYSEYTFTLSEYMRQVAVMNFVQQRNKAKYNTARIEKSIEVSEKYKEENWKDISQAALERELDIIFVDTIEKLKIDQYYTEMEIEIARAYRLFLDGIKTELISDMSIAKQETTAISTQNKIDDDLPF